MDGRCFEWDSIRIHHDIGDVMVQDVDCGD